MLSWFWGSGEEGNQQIASPTNQLKFTIHGEEHAVNAVDVSPATSLNEYLRDKMILRGTKKMCYEGGCGACLVAVTKPGEDKAMAINSCLVSILTCHGWNIETVEGIGGPLTQYHPVQQALRNFNGTQCGYCSPGMVMNMYALCKDGKPTMKEVENSFGGNLCRCTGYRPILTAFKSLCKDASPELLGRYPDIEDFVWVKPKNGSQNGKHCTIKTPLEVTYTKSKWRKVFTLKDLLSALANIQDEIYMLVAGNTAKGVYVLPDSTIFIDVIEVKELVSYEVKNDLITLGGNMSLTNTMELFNRVSEMNSGFEYLKTIANHIDLIANVPVRNVGTLAGNLMMKHYFNEFPSDLVLSLETFAAKIVLVDTNGTEKIVTIPEFLTTNMRKMVIKSIQLAKLSGNYKYETYKIMTRAQNTHALINAGFLLKLDNDNKVESARILVGNIDATFMHAVKTESYLIGKELFNNYTLQGAFGVLNDEMQPHQVDPEPDPIFRKQLAISLFYKTILSFAPEGRLSPRNRSGGPKMVRPLSNGTQDYQTKESLYPLTKAIPKLESLAQVSGRAEYVDDMPDLPNQLYAKFVVAKAAPNSKIVSLDASKALALKGVVKFFTKDDIPGANNFFPASYGGDIVEKIFCDKVVQYYHQPVGLFVATNKDVLYEAVDLVKIKYSKPKDPPLLKIRDIVKAKATEKIFKDQELKPKKIGDNTKHTISGRMDLGGQYHFHMETQCCVTIPTEDGLDMYPSSQWMDLLQCAVAEMLNINQSKIRITVRRCGGGFGAKLSRNSLISCATALAAWILKKPVRMSLTLKENMEICGKRFPFAADYKVQVDDDGVIQQLSSQLYSDHANAGNERGNSNFFLFDMLESMYNTDPFDIVFYRTSSDAPGNTFMRAPGSLEAMTLLENIMDHISYELKLDPIQVRINNIREKKVLDYLDDLKEWANIEERKQQIIAFNKESRWRKKGLSVIPMTFRFINAGPYSVTISVFHLDGSVSISHGGTEIGQGVNTKAAQVCAYKLNIPMEKVHIEPSNTTSSPNNYGTGGSITSDAICYAVDKATDQLLLRLKPFRTDESQTWEELIKAAYVATAELRAIAQYTPKEPFVSPYLIYGACASEVELDLLTGQYQITRVDLIEDVGTSLSPFVDIGQIEGAFVQGMGYFTSENLIYSKDGQMLTNNTWFYRPPGAKDIPIDFRVKIPKDNPNPLGVLQSKAVGEPPLCLAVSVPLAIRNALASARADSDSSQPQYVLFDGPTSTEFTFKNSLNDYKQYIL
ncbi:hypothetical protein WA026_012444 [Henosepilachna vigintioctopunctata]|uniref:Aldehyde oxidase n=1 Tax=Henosepilachna vigintioctopunctata TaxID=420089 RepID=A0AAW1V0F4_9CUCU